MTEVAARAGAGDDDRKVQEFQPVFLQLERGADGADRLLVDRE